MNALRRVRDVVKQVEVPLYFVTVILGLYLAAGNVLRGAKWPDEATWEPWSAWLLLLVGSAVYVPLYALYKAIDAHLEAADKKAVAASQERTELQHDLEISCQKVVSVIAERCPQVDVNDLAAQVWLCHDEGSFTRFAEFYLPAQRKSSGIDWRKGKGAAGIAWEHDEDIRIDLRPLQARAKSMSAKQFDRLPLAQRLGMTAGEVVSTSRYTGICAIRLFSRGSDAGIRAIFIIDYLGTGDFDAVANESEKRTISDLLGGCEKRLSDASVSL